MRTGKEHLPGGGEGGRLPGGGGLLASRTLQGCFNISVRRGEKFGMGRHAIAKGFKHGARSLIPSVMGPSRGGSWTDLCV